MTHTVKRDVFCLESWPVLWQNILLKPSNTIIPVCCNSTSSLRTVYDMGNVFMSKSASVFYHAIFKYSFPVVVKWLHTFHLQSPFPIQEPPTLEVDTLPAGCSLHVPIELEFTASCFPRSPPPQKTYGLVHIDWNVWCNDNFTFTFFHTLFFNQTLFLSSFP